MFELPCCSSTGKGEPGAGLHATDLRYRLQPCRSHRGRWSAPEGANGWHPDSRHSGGQREALHRQPGAAKIGTAQIGIVQTRVAQVPTSQVGTREAQLRRSAPANVAIDALQNFSGFTVFVRSFWFSVITFCLLFPRKPKGRNFDQISIQVSARCRKQVQAAV